LIKIGGFAGEGIGWRWVEGVMAIFTGVILFIGIIMYPETYAPVLLRWRAQKLSKATGLVYRSKFEEKGQVSLLQLLKTCLSRPWIFLFREPIVLLLSIYMAIIYGILYMMFGAFPIVYEEERGWSVGIGGLAFVGIAVGFIFAVIYCLWDNRRYSKLSDAAAGHPVPPEARLPPAIIGAFALPIGLFWFAWTNYPSVHFMASICGGIPFGFGMLLVFLASMNYLIDTYVIYAASVLAANSVLRSLFGAIFRKSFLDQCYYLIFAIVALFTTQMFHNLGIHWAASIPAFLALICLPIPYIFWKYGDTIRGWSKYSAEAAAFVARKSIAHIADDTTAAEVKPATGTMEEDEDAEENGNVMRL
jgi:hypothetical protein